MAKSKASWPFQGRPSFPASSHHGAPHKIARKAISHAVAREASSLKKIADKAAGDMKRMAAQCKADIAKARRAATVAAKKKFGAPKRKHHKKKHHKKKHSHAKAKRATFADVRQPTFGGGFGHTARKTHKHRGKKKHGKKHHKHETSVSASRLIGGATRGKKGMQRWVCEAPVRTGCGGGARGGHVLGDRSKNRAIRLR
jgi:hypothetical protein